METKKIEIEIPTGKKAEWVNGVLTLVDEQVRDNRPVTERIKTFEDACRELGEGHPILENIMPTQAPNIGNVLSADLVAYLKLRIIAAALNEGWEPQFTTDERRYYPYFVLYTENEYNDLSDEQKSRVVFRSNNAAHAYGGVAYAYTSSFSSYANASIGSRLAFKTRELAKYAGEQFIDIWADYVFEVAGAKRIKEKYKHLWQSRTIERNKEE